MKFITDARVLENIQQLPRVVEFNTVEELVDFCSANGRVEIIKPGDFSTDGGTPNTGKHVKLYFHNDYD